jgi:hypothetical protein
MRIAGVAQWQCKRFVSERLWVQLLPPAPCPHAQLVELRLVPGEMHVQLDAAGSNSLLSIMRQVTALVRRRGKFETCGEHHFCVGSPTGRRRFPQKEDSAGSNPSRRTNAHVDQRQESPPSKRGQCWFESNHGHQIRGRGGIGIRAGLKPRSLQVRSLSPAPFHARLAQRQSGAPTKLRSGFRNSQRAP